VFLPGTLALLAGCGGATDQGGRWGSANGGAGDAGGAIVVADAGFRTPESVLHESASDVYLVSNINGGPIDRAGNGFISRLSPDGEVLELRWIDGAQEGTVLDAPKGMAALDGRLFVADIDCVRVFALDSLEQLEDICFPEATFLNDLAVDANGTLYVTDSGFQVGPDGLEPSGTDAVYRFTPDGRRQNMVMSPSLGGPNGIIVGPRGIFVVTFGTGEIFRLEADAKRTPVLPESNRQLDGVVFNNDGELIFSDWSTGAVYRITRTGGVEAVLEGVTAPADIGYDAVRNRVLVPLFSDGTVYIVPLD
jgi:sugar lactone lactonase YvrE